MAIKTTARVDDAQGSPLAVAIDVSGHHLFGDEPVGRAGANRGPTPIDVLTAALGGCTAMTVRWYAQQKGWPLEHVHVEVHHVKTMANGSDEVIDQFTKAVTITGPELSDEQRAKLYDVAEKCPVHKTLTGTIRVESRDAAA